MGTRRPPRRASRSVAARPVRYAIGLTRKLTVLPLIAATYFCVSGGPFGLEDIVASSGYAGGILILIITPLIWSLPMALMISEMSSSLPHDGGYYVWACRALGRFWGFQEAWLSLIGSIFDMAIYPTLFVAYLGHLSPSLTAGSRGFWIGVAVVVVSALWNLPGAKAIGESSIWMGVLLLLPFLVLSGYAFVHPAASTGPGIPLRKVDFLGGILFAMWNYMGWDNVSTIAGEVHQPQRTYPLAMAGAVSLVTLNYLVPVAAVAATGLDPNRWSTGGWADVTRALVPGAIGPILAAAVSVAGMITALGTHNALVMSYSQLPAVMAEDGYLPRFIARRDPQTNAPWASILVCSAAWALALELTFTKLIVLDVLLTGLSILLEFASLVALRIREPDLPRPFRVPGGLPAAIALGIFPVLLLVLTVVRTDAERVGPISALQFGAILILSGVLTYFLAERFRQHDHR